MRRALPAVLLLLIAALGAAQSWISAYDDGLRAAGKGDWAEARRQFKAAAAYRPEDASAATVLPGPPTERRRWRDGAPYSPNFLAAYAQYRLATAGPEPQTDALRVAASEFEMLLGKGQNSRAAFYFLNVIYSRLADAPKRDDLAKRYAAAGKLDFNVDAAGLTPEDRAQVEALSAPAGAAIGNDPTSVAVGGGRVTEVNAGAVPNAANPLGGATSAATLASGAVAILPTKYALIVANSESRMSGGSIPYALEDARRIKDALVANAGYDPANIEVVANATGPALLNAAKALAQRFPDSGTLLIYYTGGGVNVNGKDYLAGVDTELATDTSSMLAKADLYRPFVEKGASIFAFFQVNRPILNGRYFGAELPEIGRIAQAQATIPGETIRGFYREGTLVGLYSDAFVGTLGTFRSNRIPITEFAWQLFYRLRRGDTGTSGGGGRQTPTLPTLIYLGSDARF